MSVTDKLTPAGKAFYDSLKNLAGLEVCIGYQAGKASHEDPESGEVTDMVKIAAWNEFGTSRMPSRPFLRNSVDNHKEEITGALSAIAGQVVDGMDPEQALKQAGVYGVSVVQKEITNGTFAPNAPSTVKSKGSDKPLIDTGQLRNSVHYVVRKKGSK